MTLIGYARVSTRGQSLDSQIDKLTAAGCERIFTDKSSGQIRSRPGLEDALDYARPGDSLVITDLSRLGRRINHLIPLVNELADSRVGFHSLTEQIDTTTATGRFTFHLCAALAEMQAELIREATRRGIEAARARGRKGGRPRKLTPVKLAIAQTMYDGRQHTLKEIAACVEVSERTLYNYLQRTGT